MCPRLNLISNRILYLRAVGSSNGILGMNDCLFIPCHNILRNDYWDPSPFRDIAIVVSFHNLLLCGSCFNTHFAYYMVLFKFLVFNNCANIRLGMFICGYLTNLLIRHQNKRKVKLFVGSVLLKITINFYEWKIESEAEYLQ